MRSLISALIPQSFVPPWAVISDYIIRDLEESVALFASADVLVALGQTGCEEFHGALWRVCKRPHFFQRLTIDLMADAFLIRRLQDWAASCALIPIDFESWKSKLYGQSNERDPVIGVEELHSDPHGLQGVFRLQLRDGSRLVYRRRPKYTDDIWNLAVQTLNDCVTPPIRLPRCRSVGDDLVTWQSAVTSLRTIGDPKALSIQWGLLLALAQLCRLTDAHRANFIVSVDGPILIDTETILSPPSAPTESDPVARLIEASITSSILATGMLPRPRRLGKAWVDISPLTLLADTVESISQRPGLALSEGKCTVVWRDNGGFPILPGGLAQCSQTLGSAATLEALLEGYRAGVAHADKVASAVANSYQGCTRRSVLRPTYHYREELLRKRLHLRPASAASLTSIDTGDLTTRLFSAAERDEMAEWRVPIFRGPLGAPIRYIDAQVNRSTVQIQQSIVGVPSLSRHETPLTALRERLEIQSFNEDCYVYDSLPADRHSLCFPSGLSICRGLAGIILTLDRFDPILAERWRERSRDWLSQQCREVVQSNDSLPLSRLVPGGPLHGLLYLSQTTLAEEHTVALQRRLQRACMRLPDGPEGPLIRLALNIDDSPSSIEIHEALVDSAKRGGIHHEVGYWILDSFESSTDPVAAESRDHLVKQLLDSEAEDSACRNPFAHLRLNMRAPLASIKGCSPSRFKTGLDGLAGEVWIANDEYPSTTRRK